MQKKDKEGSNWAKNVSEKGEASMIPWDTCHGFSRQKMSGPDDTYFGRSFSQYMKRQISFTIPFVQMYIIYHIST